MAIRILLILLLINIDVFAETEREIYKRFSDRMISEMEKRCKISEKEQAAKKHKVDAVPDSSSAIAIALDAAYSMHDAVPKVNTSGGALLIGEHKEYWYVAFHSLMRDYNIEVEFKGLISRNSGTLLCSFIIKSKHKF